MNCSAACVLRCASASERLCQHAACHPADPPTTCNWCLRASTMSTIKAALRGSMAVNADTAVLVAGEAQLCEEVRVASSQQCCCRHVVCWVRSIKIRVYNDRCLV
jgi:hypothetical protein